MKAWQFTAVGKPLTCNDIPEPEAGTGEIVIDVKAVGLCHSDVGFLDGTLASLLPFRPITLGHEIAGVVASTGPGARRFSVGDRVAVPAAIEGPGTSSNGGFQPKVAVRENLAIPLPDGIAWDQAAAATDAGLTSYHAMIVQGAVTAGTKVGVIGFGGLGSLGAQIALAVGAEVFVVEKNEKVHAFARDLGVTDVAADMAAFADKKLDVIVDFAGFGTTTNAAVEAVRRDGRVVLVGLGVGEGTINLQALTLNQVMLIGSQAGTPEDCQAVLQLIADGKVTSRITHIGFDQIGDGIGKLERGEVIGRLVVLYD
ncbi:zinc-binding dehydrogenase [Streptomyces sp. KM273126]|uniref:zinc-binding dehydrogenase n=1 Tax=Streptomyces sp. KM273126 TaxID=2545247 RepID=UPI00103CA16F|nr:zinc-binding dehydrogenase [Streptomyces sp. KM273126]MBA2813856.1 zinc-binding dehydrogenase [Streptomyces sp. KM273126]